MPLSRSGKNNVLMMCIPNPPLNDKAIKADTAVSILLRVKTSDDADELLEKLKQAKDK